MNLLRVLGIIIVAVLILSFLVIILSRIFPPLRNLVPTPPSAVTPTPAVSSPFFQGNTIVFSNFQMPFSGFIVLRSTDENRNPGSVLAFSTPFSSEPSDVYLSIPSNLPNGQPLMVQLFRDNGNLTFEPETDTPLSGPSGFPYIFEFALSPSPSM